MVGITAADLRQITEAAIASAQHELSAKKSSIFRTAMEQLKVDASAGRNHSVAMSLKSGDDYDAGTRSTRSLKPEQLVGVAALIFKQCQIFEPTLEYWSKLESDMRNETWTVSGFNIVLHWGNVEELLTRLGALDDDTTARAIREGILAAQAAVTDKAAGILGQLKAKAQIQAKAGKNWVIVMGLKAGTDFEIPTGKRIGSIEYAWLGPVAKAVWDSCASFAPTFEYWSKEQSDMRGESWTEEGVNIVAHW